jgi:hypothetical protein
LLLAQFLVEDFSDFGPAFRKVYCEQFPHLGIELRHFDLLEFTQEFQSVFMNSKVLSDDDGLNNGIRMLLVFHNFAPIIALRAIGESNIEQENLAIILQFNIGFLAVGQYVSRRCTYQTCIAFVKFRY